MAKKNGVAQLDTEALSATMSGFLASQVLSLQFLVQEGIVDKDRFLTYLQAAMEGMRPGISDARSLVALSQLINSLRAMGSEANPETVTDGS